MGLSAAVRWSQYLIPEPKSQAAWFPCILLILVAAICPRSGVAHGSSRAPRVKVQVASHVLRVVAEAHFTRCTLIALTWTLVYRASLSTRQATCTCSSESFETKTSLRYLRKELPQWERTESSSSSDV